MTSNADRASAAAAAAGRPRWLQAFGALGASRRTRSCPQCGLRIRDPVAARLGFCDRCKDFTGMCGAGRRIVSADMMTNTSWHTPCTNAGAVAWEFGQHGEVRRTLLCAEHDAQMRSGAAPFVGAAVPLADGPGTGRPR